MVKSMTGYGRASDGEFTIELKSFNHRYLDISIRTPRLYSFLDEKIKAIIQKHVRRGKIELQLSVVHKSLDVGVYVNETVLNGYLAAARDICERYELVNDLKLSDIMRLPEVLSMESAPIDMPGITALVENLLCEALEEFQAMRAGEGRGLALDILSRCEEIRRMTAMVEERSAITVLKYRNRLEKKLKEILEDRMIDESRLITEAAIFADKAAVDEEVTRLYSHISQLEQILAEGDAVGRKMDFLLQEFAREANTIGSKANDGDMTRIVVDLKSEIEKIREQLQNIE